MAKRFTSTDLWSEDWFLAMPKDYKLFWFYVLATCDYGGIFKVNITTFCQKNKCKIDPEKAIEFFNAGKLRIRVVKISSWLIEDFFVYQYGGVFNEANKVHKGVLSIYKKLGINIDSVRGLIEIKLTPKKPLDSPYLGVKDKDKDKDSLGESVKGENWNCKPVEHFELSELEVGKAEQFVRFSLHITLSQERIIEWWNAFQINHFNGINFYESREKAVKHFRDWLKFQDLKEEKNNGKSHSATLKKVTSEF